MRYINNILNTNNKIIEFEHSIEKIIEIDDILVVLLDLDPLNDDIINNVYGVKDGSIIWQVEDARNIFVDSPISYSYTLARLTENNTILLTDFNGIEVSIDYHTGKIIR